MKKLLAAAMIAVAVPAFASDAKHEDAKAAKDAKKDAKKDGHAEGDHHEEKKDDHAKH
jgi:hypothetical protein